MGTTISSPTSVTNFSSNSVVSDLENALMKDIGQGMQSGQGADSTNMQQEMQLLTALLNQSSSDSGSTASPTVGGASSTGIADPSSTASAPTTAAASPSTGSPASDSSSGSGSSSSSASNGASSDSNRGIDKTERKLEQDLESNVTSRLQGGQSPKNGNALDQEMNLLIALLGQKA